VMTDRTEVLKCGEVVNFSAGILVYIVVLRLRLLISIEIFIRVITCSLKLGCNL
jgi:hypothetical protein